MRKVLAAILVAVGLVTCMDALHSESRMKVGDEGYFILDQQTFENIDRFDEYVTKKVVFMSETYNARFEAWAWRQYEEDEINFPYIEKVCGFFHYINGLTYITFYIPFHYTEDTVYYSLCFNIDGKEDFEKLE